VILLGSWIVTLMSHPTPTTSIPEIVARASFGPFPGLLIIASMLVFYSALLGLGVYS
jgi:uncharacterized membrane protein